MLRPTGQLDIYTRVVAGPAEPLDDVRDECLTLTPFAVELFGQLGVFVGLEVPQTQILEFPLQLPDAEPVCQRRVYQLGLARHPMLHLGW